MNPLLTWSLDELTQRLRRGEVSSREVTLAYLGQIERLETQLHAFITLTPELALSQAEQADRRLTSWRKAAEGPLPPLLGIPMAVKDVLCVRGVRCTCGSRLLENFIPPYSATSVDLLLSGGAVLLGKTNTDEFAMGSSTENSAFGPTRNPWDLERVPGGSSGGSAAAVAAGLAPFALGTDTGGSVRQPAAHCGVCGLKPTYGRVSRFGLVAFGSSLDTVGILGRSAADLLTVFQRLAVPDPRDATCVDIPFQATNLDATPEQVFKGLRLGVAEEYLEGRDGLQSEVADAIQEALRVMEAWGALVKRVHLEHTSYALPVYYIIAPAEASANLARYDGVRYGQRAEGAESLWEIFSETRGQKFGAEVKRRIMLGTYALSAGYYEAYYGRAQKVRTLLRQDFERAFEDVDVLVTPVAPNTAFRLGERRDDPLAMYLEDIFTLPASLAGLPAIALPAGFDQQGLPIGMQLIAAHFGEMVLLRVAHAYQQVTDWHLHRPKLYYGEAA